MFQHHFADSILLFIDEVQVKKDIGADLLTYTHFTVSSGGAMGAC